MSRARALRRRAPPRTDDADPLALHSPLRARAFFAVLDRRLRRAFAAVRVAGDADAIRRTVAGRPLVVYCNHPAWWDVAVVATVARLVAPERRLFAPFDAEALARYRFLARCGAFALDPSSPRGARRLLEIGGRVLADPRSLLGVTPQGAFRDPRERPLALQRGLAGLLARTPRAVAVPVAIEYPFWTESRPEVLVRLGAPVALGDAASDAAAPTSTGSPGTAIGDDASAADGDASAFGCDAAAVADRGSGAASAVRSGGAAVGGRGTDAWHGALVGSLEAAMDALAADALARDPSRFRALHESAVGVGGVYDLWRRARAAFAGRRFDARHGATPDARGHRSARPAAEADPC